MPYLPMYKWARDCSDKATSWPFDLLLDYHIDLLESLNLLHARMAQEFRVENNR